MRRRWHGPVIEIAVSFLAAAALAWTCTGIKVNPLDRVGQVSGLASIQVRFLLFAVPLLAGVLVAAKLRGGAWFPVSTRVACAALAGLASGFVAGGVIVALRGTPFCLNAGAGDSEIIVMWANALRDGRVGEYPPPFYPPLFPQVLSYYMQAADLPAAYALKDLQIAGTAIAGPLAYLAWRLVLRPGWALAIGVTAALVVIDPYKPYGNLVLVVFVPVSMRYFARLREAADKSPYELVRTGVVYGVALGILCLTYSGWFKWAAPGLVVAAALVFPWRRGWKHGVLFGSVTLAMIAIVCWNYFWGMFHYAQVVSQLTGGKGPLIVDEYQYFDVAVEPTYFAMWKGDLPGTTTVWPPPGELAGIGLFALALYAGVGVAVALGRRRTEVITLGAVFAATWFQRFWQAHYMFKTKLVQLWPRTTLAIDYMLVVFAGLAIYYAVERAQKRAAEDSPLRGPNALIGAITGLTLLFGSVGSSLADRYMPFNSLPRSTGWLAYLAHEAKRAATGGPPLPSPSAPK